MSENLRHDIICRWHAGESMRSIAKALGVTRYRVSEVLAAHQAGRAEGALADELGEPKKRRSRGIDKYETALRHLLERYSDITAVRAYEELKNHGFSGGYGAVKKRIRELRPGRESKFVQRFETAPGAQAQMDYSTYTIDFTSEGRRRVHLFSYLLGYSRRQYLRFVESQDFATTIREHVRAFEHLQGVAATCLYDNMKVVVMGYDGGEPVYNARFLGFAAHYGYRPIACRPRRSQTKGKVERPFYYVERNLLNGRTFQSLEHLNDVTRAWLANVADVRMHRETNETPLDRWRTEQSLLIPLPAHAYDTAEVVYRCVSVEGLVAYCQNRYSVPWRYIGLTLPVRVTEEELIVYNRDLEEVARHRLLPRHASGQTVALEAHRPTDDSEKKYEILKKRYEELGPAAARFLEGLIRHRRYGRDEAHKILALLEIYHRQDLLAAIERAVSHGAYSRSAIERILAVSAAPKTALDRLAEREQDQLKSLLDDPRVEPRKSQEYQDLLDGAGDRQEGLPEDGPETTDPDDGEGNAADEEPSS